MGIIPDIFNDIIETPDGRHLDIKIPDKEFKDSKLKEKLKKRKLLRNKYNLNKKKKLNEK